MTKYKVEAYNGSERLMEAYVDADGVATFPNHIDDNCIYLTVIEGDESPDDNPALVIQREKLIQQLAEIEQLLQEKGELIDSLEESLYRVKRSQ